MVINIYEPQKFPADPIETEWSQVKQSAFAHFCGGESLEASLLKASLQCDIAMEPKRPYLSIEYPLVN